MIEDPTSALFVALYTDEDVTTQLAILLRQRGFQAQSASEAGMLQQPDEAHLSYTTTHRMVLFSFNIRDYMVLSQEWAAVNRRHTGILLSEQYPLSQMGELLRRLLRFLNAVSADEMVNTVHYLSEFSQESKN